MVWNVRIDVETNNYTVDYESTLPSFGVGSANAIAGGVIDCLAGSGVGALRGMYSDAGRCRSAGAGTPSVLLVRVLAGVRADRMRGDRRLAA